MVRRGWFFSYLWRGSARGGGCLGAAGVDIVDVWDGLIYVRR